MLEFRIVQDRYVGDIGDLAKFALLKALANDGFRLGVHWYLNVEPETNNDGRLVAYPKLRECDPELYDSLQRLVSSGARLVSAVERSGVLPSGTIFFSEPLPSRTGRDYIDRRRDWSAAALKALHPADIVFVDPDNGFPPSAQSKSHPNKFVTTNELRPYLDRGQSVIVYQHQSRERGGLRATIPKAFDLLRGLGCAHPYALVFRRQSVRVYLVLPAPKHHVRLRELIRKFLDTQWGVHKHFQLESHITIRKANPPSGNLAERLWPDATGVERGKRLFRYLVDRANRHAPVGIGYATFLNYLHGVERFREIVGRNYAQCDTPFVVRIATEITELAGGRMKAVRNGRSIDAGMDTFIWSSESPFTRPKNAWTGDRKPPYSRNDWLAIFPDGERQMITSDELKSVNRP